MRISRFRSQALCRVFSVAALGFTVCAVTPGSFRQCCWAAWHVLSFPRLVCVVDPTYIVTIFALNSQAVLKRAKVRKGVSLPAGQPLPAPPAQRVDPARQPMPRPSPRRPFPFAQRRPAGEQLLQLSRTEERILPSFLENISLIENSSLKFNFPFST